MKGLSRVRPVPTLIMSLWWNLFVLSTTVERSRRRRQQEEARAVAERRQ
jgi:hypothetical protein